MNLKKPQHSQLKSLGINETKINLFSFMHRGLLFFLHCYTFMLVLLQIIHLCYFCLCHIWGEEIQTQSLGWWLTHLFPYKEKKQWIEFLWLNLDFKLHKLNIYTHIYMHIHIYVFACVWMCTFFWISVKHIESWSFFDSSWNAPLKEDLC